MKDTVEIFWFIDALGWQIAENYGFLRDRLPYRQPVAMQFGYSSSAVPTILTGRAPVEHGHLSPFYYDPEHSPFKMFRYVRVGMRPDSIWNRGRVRSLIGRMLKRWYGYSGYFQIYSIPFTHLPYLNYAEKEDIFAPDGLAPVRNIHDVLLDSGLPFHISDWRCSETVNIGRARQAVKDGKKFIFLYTAGMDALLHERVSDSAAIRGKLDFYAAAAESLAAAARENGRELHLTVISDHGMTPLTGTVDIISRIEALGLEFGTDYVGCYDSTMARFWFLRDGARGKILPALEDCPGHWISAEEEKRYGIDFPDHKCGDAIFLLEPGIQICPSDMGARPMAGMHGYIPEDSNSTAALLSNVPLEPDTAVGHVSDYFAVMCRRIEALREEKA